MGKKKHDTTFGALLPFGGACPPGFGKEDEELFDDCEVIDFNLGDTDFEELFGDDDGSL